MTNGNIVVSNTSAGTGISLNMSGGIETKLIVESGAHVDAASGIGVKADDVDLQGTMTTAAIRVAFETQDAVLLGSSGDTTPGALELSDAELDRITAPSIQIGGLSAGSVTIPDAISLTSVDTLHLITSGSVTQVSPLFVKNLAVTAGGEVRLHQSGGRVTIEDTPAAVDVESTDLMRLTVGENEGLLSIASGATVRSTAGAHTYIADKVDLSGTIAAVGQIVTLRSLQNNEAIDLGSTTDASVNTLELSDAELDRITADVLRIGRSTAGSITISDVISLTTIDPLHLFTSDTINDGGIGAIAVANLAIDSGGSVTLDNWTLGNFVSVLAATITNVDAGIRFENNGALVIGSVDGVVGITTNGGGITLVTHSPLTIGQPLQDFGGGNIQLTASDSGGDDDDLLIQSTVVASGGDGNIELTAGDDLTIEDLPGTEITASGTGDITVTTEDEVQLAVGVTLVTEQGGLQVVGSSAALSATDAADHVQVMPGSNPGEVQVFRDGTLVGTFTVAEKLIVHGLGGDDTIEAIGNIEIDVWFFGDAGNDHLKGGKGDDVLLGGSGDDLLVGHQGRDFLAGGTGVDRIVGNADDDIVIADELIWERDDFSVLEAALTAITAEWTRQDRTYEERIENLDGDGNFVSGERFNGDYVLKLGTTVLIDDSADKLTGSSGSDWFFFNDQLDRATDPKDEVFADDLDWILL